MHFRTITLNGIRSLDVDSEVIYFFHNVQNGFFLRKQNRFIDYIYDYSPMNHYRIDFCFKETKI